MDRRQLLATLAFEGIDARLISTDGQLRGDAWIIETTGDRWTTYYYDERGLSEGEISFSTENEVCAYLLRTLKPELLVEPGSELDVAPIPLDNPPSWAVPGCRWVELDGLPVLALVSDDHADDWPYRWGELPEGKRVLRDGSLIDVEDSSSAEAAVSGVPGADEQAREPRHGIHRYKAGIHLLVACSDSVIMVGSAVILPAPVSRLGELRKKAPLGHGIRPLNAW